MHTLAIRRAVSCQYHHNDITTTETGLDLHLTKRPRQLLAQLALVLGLLFKHEAAQQRHDLVHCSVTMSKWYINVMMIDDRKGH